MKSSHSFTCKLVVFDFDGTLGDTTTVILNTLKATFETVGISAPDDDACRSIIGLPLKECFTTLIPTLSEDTANRCTSIYHQLFSTFDTDDAVTLYPHVYDVIEILRQKGIIMAIASSRNHHSLEKYSTQLHLQQIALLIGADDVQQAKPHPEPVQRIMTHFGCTPQETLVVGDAPYDIIMGKSAGCTTCGVTYGNGSREALKTAGADFLIDSIKTLPQIIFA